MRKLLKTLWVIQESKSNKVKRRLNPYNPLTYLTILITIIVGLLLFGFVGLWGEIDKKNPFKFQ